MGETVRAFLFYSIAGWVMVFVGCVILHPAAGIIFFGVTLLGIAYWIYIEDKGRAKS